MRVDQWERRLLEVVNKYNRLPYRLGISDCFTLTQDVIQALSGKPWPSFEIPIYRTRAEALAALNERGYDTMPDLLLDEGLIATSIKYAQRGDIGYYIDDDGTPHFVICMAGAAFGYFEDGLRTVPFSKLQETVYALP